MTDKPISGLDPAGTLTGAELLAIVQGGVSKQTSINALLALANLGALALLDQVGAAQVADGAVTNAKLANAAEATLKGRAAGAGTGAPQDLTAAQVKTMLAITQADVTGLVTRLEGIDTTLAGKAAASHTHLISSISGLQAALDGKAALLHTHAIADVTGLQAALDAVPTTFLELDDTPTAYTGLGGRFLRVKATEDGLETAAPAMLTATMPANLGPAALVGDILEAARADHVHAYPAPADIGAATAAQGALADTAVQPAALAPYAPLADPAFTGNPTAPTQDAADNTTKLATTAFVRTVVAALVDSSPAALDTLNELAAALGDDPNFAATMTTALAGKQPLHGILTAIAGLTLSPNKLLRASGPSTFDLIDITGAGAALLDDADTATQRATLGLTIGTDVQAHAAKLDALAALTWGADLAPYFTGAAALGSYSLSAFMRGIAASASAAQLRRAIFGRAHIDPVSSAVLKNVYASHVPLATATRNRIVCVPAADGVTNPGATYPGSGAFIGSVLLSDGRVFCVPYNSTTARIYDPVTNMLTTPAGTYPGGGAFAGGILLPDGRVFLVPANSTSARIYDPVADTLMTPSGTYPGSSAFFGGALLPDGRVFCAPRHSTTARIYDPVADMLTTPSGTYPGSNAFTGCVLLVSGKVFLVPRNSTTARIYDPFGDTLTTPTGTYPGADSFVGGVLLGDGRVFLVPASSTTARIYDPVADALTIPSGTYPGSGAFAGGALLPDRRVFCVPSSSTTARIYDPVADVLTTPSGTYPGSAGFVGGTLLADASVFLAPFNATSSILAVGAYSHRGLNFPTPLLMGGTLNKF